MLTLVKTKDATPIVGIFVGKKHKKPVATVFFTHEINHENANVAPCSGVLHLHKNDIKKELHLNESDFKEICRMIDAGDEPEKEDPLRHVYWATLEKFERFLKREMYIGDDPETRFEMNFPRNRETWPGTLTAIASSGGGKTHFVVAMILRYLKNVEPHNRRSILWISPELDIDKSLKPLRDNRKWDMWFHGIDISEKTLREKGMDAASYYQKKISEKNRRHWRECTGGL